MIKQAEGTLSKQQALHAIEEMRKKKEPIYGVEITREHKGVRESSMFKSTWYTSQRLVYKKARDFVMKQMTGEWQTAEIKST